MPAQPQSPASLSTWLSCEVVPQPTDRTATDGLSLSTATNFVSAGRCFRWNAAVVMARIIQAQAARLDILWIGCPDLLLTIFAGCKVQAQH